LRSIDAFNTHDDAFRLSISGGVTSAQILPGSGNAIGSASPLFQIYSLISPDRWTILHGEAAEDI
jgi:hypothetical protein